MKNSKKTLIRILKKLSLSCLILATLTTCGHSKKSSSEQTRSKAKHVLFVLSSNGQMGDTGKKTGVWLEEFTTPYYALFDNGFKITLASPKGGQVPFDPSSMNPEAGSESTKRYETDQKLKDKLSKTVLLSKVNSNNYDAVYYPGGHGLLWDLVRDKHSISLIEEFFQSGKPIGAVCHGPAVFAFPKGKNGFSIVDGKKVTGFSNTEESAIQLSGTVPFLLEDKLKENGGIYAKGDNWKSFVQVDGNLITGQNPGSSEAVAKALIKAMQ